MNFYARMGMTLLNVMLFLMMMFDLGARPYNLGVCSLFRDDAKYIPEWIDFHLAQGVEHFWLYNNLSRDDYQNILRPYVDAGVVTIVNWPHEPPTPDRWPEMQNAAFTHCVSQNLWTHWIAFIDTDEFLFAVDGRDLKVFLRDYDKYQCLCVDWQFYGTSGVYDAGGSLIKKLLYRAPDDYCVATKCIVKPLWVNYVHYAHYFVMRDITKCVDENFNVVDPFKTMFKKQTINKIRINHYFCRDQWFMHNVKIPRMVGMGRKPERLYEQESMSNTVFDNSILHVIK